MEPGIDAKVLPLYRGGGFNEKELNPARIEEVRDLGADGERPLRTFAVNETDLARFDYLNRQFVGREKRFQIRMLAEGHPGIQRQGRIAEGKDHLDDLRLFKKSLTMRREHPSLGSLDDFNESGGICWT
jgi:hypothetical protein